MRRGGVAFVYVTHRLDELDGLVDRVTVLRNGQRVVTAAAGDLSHDQLVGHILGPQASERAGARRVRKTEVGHLGEPHLVVSGLTTAELPHPLSFEVRAGEVLGVCGLVGSGTRELAQTLAGTRTPTGGTVTAGGRPLLLGSPQAVARSGCTVVPGDRQLEGVVTGLGIRENLLPTRRDFGAWSPVGLRHHRRETRAVMTIAEQYGVVPRDHADRDMASLSGGNQQKVIFARALADRPAVAVLEDPTAGVDIGSRAVLHELMHEAARAGTAVVLISTDFDEVAEQSDRVLVLSHGQVVAELDDVGEIDADRLAEASYAGAPGAGPSTRDGR
jgi:ribose transport system ATP-binding protein